MVRQLTSTNRRASTAAASTTTTSLNRMADQVISPQLARRIMGNINVHRMISMAHEVRQELQFKAIGTVVDWIPISLPSPVSLGVAYVAPAYYGTAARAGTVIPIEPLKAVEILTDKLSWCRDCRKVDVYATFSDNNGGIIELINTQYYAPSTKACARDFWTLRYTCVIDEHCLLVCEKSISGSDVVQSSPIALEFVRTKILTSGYLIRPFDDGSKSTIYVVDHLDLESSSVPGIVQPLYLSPQLVLKRLIAPALQYIEHIATETKKNQTHANDGPTFYRCFGQKLTRGFNDAVNGFNEDGWTLSNVDVSDDVYISIKHDANGVNANFDGVVCVKTSLLLQNVLPAKVVRLLKERRPTWMNFNFANYLALHSRAPGIAFPGSNTHRLSGTAVLLGKTNYHDEILEIIRFERVASMFSSRDIYHLQITNGIEDTDFGDCSELIFAPVDRNLPNDAVLLSSGFRVFLLGANTVQATQPSANLVSNEASGTSNTCSMLVLAFQFPFMSHLQEDTVAMAKSYAQNVISSVKSISLEIMPSASAPVMNPTEENPATALDIPEQSNFAANLANFICQSYSSSLGLDFLGDNFQSNDLVGFIEHHQYAILCFSFTSIPACLYANQAGFNMLETTRDNVQVLTLDKILDGRNEVSLYSIIPIILEQGYSIVPPGFFFSLMNRRVFYEQAVVWLVKDLDGSIQCLAAAFMNWSFV